MNFAYFFIFWEAVFILGAVAFYFIPKQWEEVKRKDRQFLNWLRQLFLILWIVILITGMPTLIVIAYAMFDQPIPGALRILSGILSQSRTVFFLVMFAMVYSKGYKVGK